MAGRGRGRGHMAEPQMAQVDMGAMFAQLLQAVQNQPGQGDSFAKRNKDFGSLGGQKFNGEGTPQEAEAWVRKCEFVFERMQLTRVQKQELATQQLEGAALFWWEASREQYDVADLEWEDFRGMFEENFIPSAVKSQLAREFQDLTQGSLTVAQYVKKFNELSRYAPYLIDTEEKKNEKFIDGLGHHISKLVTVSDREPFSRVVDLALKFERKEQKFQTERASQKAKVSETSRDTRSQT